MSLLRGGILHFVQNDILLNLKVLLFIIKTLEIIFIIVILQR
jgi:hypothetical protein